MQKADTECIGRCPLLLLRTFSAHAKVATRDAKEMGNTHDTRMTRGLVLSPVSLEGSSYIFCFSTDEK